MEETKCCKICNQTKPLNHFYKTCFYKNKQCYRAFCIDCEKKIQKENRERVNNSEKPKTQNKTCVKCKLLLPVNNFHIANCRKDGLQPWCKTCERTQKPLRRKRIRGLPAKEITGKICSVCKQYRIKEEYTKCCYNKDKLSIRCKHCDSKYRKENRKVIRQKWVERYKKDPVFRLCCSIRTRILNIIKRKSDSKKSHSFELLGCTGKECMGYLEKLFWPGMTKENMGRNGWVLDHVVPLVSFDKNDPNWQFKAFHYTNLQPLWKEDNEKKNNRLDWTPQESKYELPERLKIITSLNKSDSKE